MSPATSDATARRLLLRHPPGLSPDEAQALRTALEGAVGRQQELAGRHPAIVAVRGLAVDAEGYWLEEPADGRSLETTLAEDAPLDERRVAALGVQICDALRAACYPPDSLPRPHGALRPACVRVTGDRLQLSDLGIAAALIDVLGSAAPREELDLVAPYVARELWLQAGALGELRDMFAVGVILYELATGRHPYDVDRHDYNDCEQRILTAEPQPAQEVHTALGDSFSSILDRAVARREEDRFPSLSDLRDALLPLAGASALEWTAAVPAEACALDLREGAQADATGVATLLMRFATAVAERSGLLGTDRLTVELADLRWHDDASIGTASARITAPPLVTSAVAIDIAIRKTDSALRIDDPAAGQRALLDAVQPTILAAQRAGLDRALQPLRDGLFPAARAAAELESAVPATLLTIDCLPEPQSATIELSLVWNPARGTWDEREPGSLAGAVAAVAQDAALAAVKQRVRRVADVLMANEAALRWTVTAPPPTDGMPASIPLTVRVDWQPDAESGQTLVEFALPYPISDEHTIDRHLRRAERELGKLQSAAPAGAGATAGRGRLAALAVPLTGVVVIAALVIAWVAWPRSPGRIDGTGGGGNAEPNASDTRQEPPDDGPAATDGASRTTTAPGDGAAESEPDRESGPAAAERQRIAALRTGFDTQVQRLRDQLANPAGVPASTYTTFLAAVLDRFEPDRADLTPAQQGELTRLRSSLEAVETLEARLAAARETLTFDTLAEAVRAVPGAVSWPDETPARVQESARAAAGALQLAAERQEAGDPWGVGRFLDRAQQTADELARAAGLAAPLADLFTQLHAQLADVRRQALQPSLAQAETWLTANGAAPADPAERFERTAVAGQARVQLDALGLQFPVAVLDSLGFGLGGAAAAADEPAAPGDEAATLDGVLRWDDLQPPEQQTIEELLAWVLISLRVTPAGSDALVSIPLACLAPADGPNGGAVWIGRTEVTVDQYRALVGSLPNSDAEMAAHGAHPVGYVILEQAEQFCAALYEAAGNDRLVMRLPHALEWERACLAGRGTLLDALPALRRYDLESGAMSVAVDRANFLSRELDTVLSTHADGFARYAPVGSYPPNAWQLVDMLGNVRELVKIDIRRLEGRGSGYSLPVDPRALQDDPFQRDAHVDGLRPQEDVGFRIVVEWL